MWVPTNTNITSVRTAIRYVASFHLPSGIGAYGALWLTGLVEPAQAGEVRQLAVAEGRTTQLMPARTASSAPPATRPTWGADARWRCAPASGQTPRVAVALLALLALVAFVAPI